MERVLRVCEMHREACEEAMRGVWSRRNTHLGIDPRAAITKTGEVAGTLAGVYAGSEMGAVIGGIVAGPPGVAVGTGIGAGAGAIAGWYSGKKITEFTLDAYIFSRREIRDLGDIWLRRITPGAQCIRRIVQEVIAQTKKTDLQSIFDDYVELVKPTWLPSNAWQGGIQPFREARERLLEQCYNQRFEVTQHPVCRMDDAFFEHSYDKMEILSTLNKSTGTVRCFFTSEEFRPDALRVNDGAVALLRCVEMNYLRQLGQQPAIRDDRLNSDLVRMAYTFSQAEMAHCIQREIGYRRAKIERIPLDRPALIEQQEAIIEVITTFSRALVGQAAAQWQPI